MAAEGDMDAFDQMNATMLTNIQAKKNPQPKPRVLFDI